jgi:NTE family protein
MGAIMGGLYAMGYSPEFIENMVSEQNWNDLITDK